MSNKKSISAHGNNFNTEMEVEHHKYIQNKVNHLSLEPIHPDHKIKSAIFPNHINYKCPFNNTDFNHNLGDSLNINRKSESIRITDTHKMNKMELHHSTDKSTFIIDTRGNNPNRDQLRDSDILFSLKSKTSETNSPK